MQAIEKMQFVAFVFRYYNTPCGRFVPLNLFFLIFFLKMRLQNCLSIRAFCPQFALICHNRSNATLSKAFFSWQFCLFAPFQNSTKCLSAQNERN
ncbi:MAG: hypothetical protein ACI4QL_01385, partial [Candidatus Fimimonas sp.]